MVSVCPGLTLFSSRFKAYAGALAYYSSEASRDKSRTGHRLDVVRRMHRHHLGVDPNAIFPVRIQTVWDLDQGQRGRGFRVKVVPDRVRPPVHIQRIRHDVVTWEHSEMRGKKRIKSLNNTGINWADTRSLSTPMSRNRAVVSVSSIDVHTHAFELISSHRDSFCIASRPHQDVAKLLPADDRSPDLLPLTSLMS